MSPAAAADLDSSASLIAPSNNQRSTENVEMSDTGAAAGPVGMAPQERDFYNDRWYRDLFLHNFMLGCMLSSLTLASAWTSTNAEVVYFGNVRDVGSLFSTRLNWVLVYAPLSAFMITLPNILLQDTKGRALKRFNVIASRRMRYCPFSLYGGLALGFATVLLFANFLLFWEDLLLLGFMTLAAWFYVPIILLYSAWYAVIFVIMRRGGVLKGC